jgi:hypothetical protein
MLPMEHKHNDEVVYGYSNVLAPLLLFLFFVVEYYLLIQGMTVVLLIKQLVFLDNDVIQQVNQ